MKNLLLIMFFAALASSCSKTHRLNLSAKKVSSLEVIYSQEWKVKYWNEKWVFFDKNICQYTSEFLGETTITGTWEEKNDTITSNFFLGKKFPETKKLYIDKENENLVPLIE